MITKRVNNVKIRKIPTEGEEDKRPIKGADLCAHLYANIYIVAKKNTGKTTLVWNIIDQCAGKDTKIFAFVSTLYNDAGWRMIRKKCEAKGLRFDGHTSIQGEKKSDKLEALVKELQESAEDEDNDDDLLPRLSCIQVAEETKAVARRPAYRTPECIIVLDDLSDELKRTSVEALLKKNRHFKCKVIISSQWLNDLPPSSLGQMSMVCMLRGFSVEKLEEFHRKARLAIPVEQFVAIYKDATRTTPDYTHGFLCIDTECETYRKKFSHQYELNDFE